MATTRARVTFRIVLAVLVIVAFFYVFRPLYWKISATVVEIRQNKQTVTGGISQIVYEAQKSVGWYHDEFDSGLSDDNRKASRGTTRRILRQVL
ncbi:uncharacterized protein LOC130757940 [Actinidia eriantha]|uniref:uncharacterized protein LOC130757940 n=1 Tax=Actinidia eriantha TaxID=165200 RepID=UPI00258D6BE1|nr:uncharacterized protein LOC130757940 [Actinidia eriantha]